MKNRDGGDSPTLKFGCNNDPKYLEGNNNMVRKDDYDEEPIEWDGKERLVVVVWDRAVMLMMGHCSSCWLQQLHQVWYTHIELPVFCCI